MDFILVDMMMAYGGINVKTEVEYEAQKSFILWASEWVGAERVNFLEYLLSTMKRAAYPDLLDDPENEDWIK
jgi:hypothetical protein